MQVKNKQDILGFLSHTKEILPFFRNFKNYNYIRNTEFIAKLNKKVENVNSDFIDFILNDIQNNLPLQESEITFVKSLKNQMYCRQYNFKDGFQLHRFITIFDDEIALTYYIYFNNVSYLDSIDIGLDGKGNLTNSVSETINQILNKLPKLTVIKRRKSFKWIMKKIKTVLEIQS